MKIAIKVFTARLIQEAREMVGGENEESQERSPSLKSGAVRI
jgi:hypothetical protein